MTAAAVSETPIAAERILIVKLGALGDFVQAFGPFQAIRRAWPGAGISLLTTEPLVDLASQSGWFDTVLADRRPRYFDVPGLFALRRLLAAGRFDLVVDLQTSGRTNAYRRLIWPRNPEWSGIASGCSHFQHTPGRNKMHTIDRQADQLAMLGVDTTPAPDVAWLINRPLGFPDLKDRYALLLPGGAPHRPEKRWPAEYYAGLAGRLAAKDIQPVILGTESETAEAETILRGCREAVSLIGETAMTDIAALAARAIVAVGNDTGPMHLASVSGCPCVVLFSHASDPALCGQRGRRVAILRSETAAGISVDRAAEAAEGLVDR